MKVHRIEIKDYRGIRTIAADVPAAGVAAVGENGTGKTSFLSALLAAFQARDVQSDAVRVGAEVAEIRVEMDDGAAVRRRISPRDQSVTVTTADKTTRRSPQTWLNDVIGPLLDPLALLEAPPKKQREMVLAALPMTVTPEMVARWTGDPLAARQISMNQHGLDVVAKLRDDFYDRRKNANAVVAEDEQRLGRARDEEANLKAAIPMTGRTGLSLQDATEALDAARIADADLQARRRAHAAASQQSAKARAAVDRLRADAQRDEADASNAPTQMQLSAARTAVARADAAIGDLERRLAAARENRANLAASMSGLERQEAYASQVLARAAAGRRQADELEETIGAIAPEVPVAFVEAAAQAVRIAESDVAAARAVNAWRDAMARTEERRTIAKASIENAERLDKVVKALTVDAPRDLMAASAGIPGLTVDGDEVAIEGVRLSKLCGAEKMFFAIQIAKKVQKSKILVVDGLEALDPGQREAFVKTAISGGWQLIASRVDAGEFRLEAFES